ncbi:RagB/SusD family nutrient uptake outer membrane protein [uncultured Draconibacterium sp.]|uniref:RagB/SusD family nutrient uptake outer membrane protein n=1 Tax=uncultured Draconibacterium sp. TaxID=1573823 RepID=UPI002AA66029|nr:RagB/SusD family nutrient uptake outer membrane protein [uncultured Draconibacterium sp.]
MKNKIYIAIILFLVLSVPYSCTEPLEEEVYSELSDQFLQTEDGLSTLVYSMYSSFHTAVLNYPRDFFVSVYMTGSAYGVGGSWEAATAAPFKDFTWDANNGHFSGKWNELFTIIRNANLVLDKLSDGGDYSDEFIKAITAEAKGVRGQAYAILYNHFGTTPIFTTTYTADLELPRATDAEMMSRIETDLNEATADLSVTASQYGRLNKGATLGFLCKYYLNTMQWQKVADASQAIMDLNVYELQDNYMDVFGVANEGNSELIWVHTAESVNHAEYLAALNLPKDYPLPPGESVFATRTYWYDSFLDSFEEGDTRLNAFETSYISLDPGNPVREGYGNDQSLCVKFGTDPNALSPQTGIDLPEIRYADIILARAEALNELSGPNQESIDLINEVRTRAGISSISLGDYTQESLRDKILEERIHELFFEGKEREDMIRNGTFISSALARGVISAADKHKLFAIPQSEIDANGNINENNPGY